MVTRLLFYVLYPLSYPQLVDKVVYNVGERLIVSVLDNTQSDNIRAIRHLSTAFVDFLWVIPEVIHKLYGVCGRIYVRLVENCQTRRGGINNWLAKPTTK